MATRVGTHGLTHHGALRLLVAVIAALVLVVTLGVTPAAAAESPTTTDELLSGMVTEGVEPGVLRVINDGVRDLASNERDLDNAVGLVAGRDGGIWFALRNRFFQLGTERDHEFPVKRLLEGRHFEVGPDGTIWTIEIAGEHEQKSKKVVALRAFDGEQWAVQRNGPIDVELAADGTVWAAWADRKNMNDTIVGYLGPDGWRRLKGSVKYGVDLLVSDSGDIWVVQQYEPGRQRSDPPSPDARPTEPDQAVLYRFLDGAWQVFGPRVMYEEFADIGADGTVWVITPSGTYVRFDGTEWQEWDPAEWQSDLEEGWPAGAPKVAPDGRLWTRWALPSTSTGMVRLPSCDGVARFDGTTWDHYLRGHCVGLQAFASDGSVWLQGTGAPWTEGTEQDVDDRLVHTYVITPEAVAAAE